MKSLKNRFNLAKDYIKRKEKSSGLPVEFSIELTNYCNSRCIMCPNKDMKRPRGRMSFETFKKIIDEIKEYSEFIYLHLAGEPLMNSKFEEMIKYANKSNLRTGLSTNAILLNKENAEKIINSKLDFIILSIDATNPITYKKVRGTDNFELVKKNIEEFIKLKNKPYTAIQLIYMDENKDEVKEFAKEWKGKVDAIRIKPVLNIGNILNKSKKRKKPCVLLWRQMAILWNGDVVSCCLDYLGDTILGNINKNSIKEIWNNEKMANLRRLHKEGKIEEISLCKNCDAPNINLPILIGGIFVDSYISKKILILLERIKTKGVDLIE